MSRWRRARTRPLWRSLVDGLIFILVLTIFLLTMQRFNIIDIGSGNAIAKDGDSLVLNGTEVRLHGIDAPEYNQSCQNSSGNYPCGREARNALQALLRGRIIQCNSFETDRYGRAISECRDGTININREMVEQGWAVAYLRHSTAFAAAQRGAKAAKRGMWQGSFEMPEDYRNRTRPITSDASGSSFPED